MTIEPDSERKTNKIMAFIFQERSNSSDFLFGIFLVLIETIIIIVMLGIFLVFGLYNFGIGGFGYDPGVGGFIAVIVCLIFTITNLLLIGLSLHKKRILIAAGIFVNPLSWIMLLFSFLLL